MCFTKGVAPSDWNGSGFLQLRAEAGEDEHKSQTLAQSLSTSVVARVSRWRGIIPGELFGAGRAGDPASLPGPPTGAHVLLLIDVSLDIP